MSISYAARVRRGLGLRALSALVCAVAWESYVSAATLPTGFAETRVATGLSSPTMLSPAPDGRVFVSEQAVRVRVIKNGTLLATPFTAARFTSERTASSTSPSVTTATGPTRSR